MFLKDEPTPLLGRRYYINNEYYHVNPFAWRPESGAEPPQAVGEEELGAMIAAAAAAGQGIGEQPPSTTSLADRRTPTSKGILRSNRDILLSTLDSCSTLCRLGERLPEHHGGQAARHAVPDRLGPRPRARPAGDTPKDFTLIRPHFLSDEGRHRRIRAKVVIMCPPLQPSAPL